MVLFRNRKEAGYRLAEMLADYRGEDNLVLAIPRGGVVVAAPLAGKLSATLDVVITRKVGAPHNPELALGAVAPDGWAIWNQELLEGLGLKPADLGEAVEKARSEVVRRMEAYREGRPAPSPEGRHIFLVDDGVATGFTAMAALRYLRRQGARETILAVPVAPAETVAMLEKEADRVVCLAMPEPFYAVGEFYREFPQVGDREVRELLTPGSGIR